MSHSFWGSGIQEQRSCVVQSWSLARGAAKMLAGPWSSVGLTRARGASRQGGSLRGVASHAGWRPKSCPEELPMRLLGYPNNMAAGLLRRGDLVRVQQGARCLLGPSLRRCAPSLLQCPVAQNGHDAVWMGTIRWHRYQQERITGWGMGEKHLGGRQPQMGPGGVVSLVGLTGLRVDHRAQLCFMESRAK